jgi:hypothetical protein
MLILPNEAASFVPVMLVELRGWALSLRGKWESWKSGNVMAASMQTASAEA